MKFDCSVEFGMKNWQNCCGAGLRQWPENANPLEFAFLRHNEFCGRNVKLKSWENVPDSVVAQMLGRTRYAVQLKRHSLGIGQCWEKHRAWTPEEDAMLGTQRDVVLAQRLNRTALSVRTRRLEKTSVRFIKTPKRWNAQELVCWVECPMAKLPVALGDFWPQFGTSVFSLESGALRRLIEVIA
jgi:hypothetical protein